MDSIITALESKSLSNYDLKSILPKTNVLTYDQLAQCEKLDDTLGEDGSCMLLYESRQGYGHWVCFFRIDESKDEKVPRLEFFDSISTLSGRPDAQLGMISKYFRKQSNQWVPHLTHLIEQSPYAVIYNPVKVQKEAKAINTCGVYLLPMRLCFEY